MAKEPVKSASAAIPADTASSTGSTDLTNSSDNTSKITSISSNLNSSDFSNASNTQYNNKWGYKPSQWVTVNAPFRGYASMEDSVNGYRDFLLRNTRYQKALQAQDAMGFLQGLYDAGYATDPNYVSRVGSIYHKIRGM